MGINNRPLSAAAFKRAQQVIPSGVNSPVRALRSVGTTPLFIERANRAYVTDIDGNTFIDFCMSWGVFILGHNNPAVSRRAIEAIQRGSSYGIPTENETLLAERVRDAFPSMERLRFVNSGTEATMSAIRVARGFTDRDTLVKFEGNYHGHADHLLVSAGSAVANISTASSAGVPDDFTKHTVCLPYNDVAALQRYFSEHGNHVAAVILEPVACNMGVVVYPAAAFGGRADIMALLAPDGPVYQAGTLSGNPVAMAAGLATLHQLATPGFYDQLEKRSSQFIAELQQIIRGKDIQLNHCGSMFTLFFNPDPVRNFADARRSDQERFTRYFQRMLERGIYVSPSQFEGNFISECHTDDILEYVLKSIKESIA